MSIHDDLRRALGRLHHHAEVQRATKALAKLTGAVQQMEGVCT